MDQALEWGQRSLARPRGRAVLALRHAGGGLRGAAPRRRCRSCSEFAHGELLAMEKDLLGVYLSGHPLEAVEARLAGDS